MEFDKIITILLAIAAVASPVIGPLLEYLENRRKEDVEKPIRDVQATSEISHTWKEITDALKNDNKDLRERLEKAEKRIDQLEDEQRQQQKDYDAELQRLAIEYAKKERGWQATLASMTERLQELEGEQRTIKKTTDELVKKTGPLPKLPGDSGGR
jgi:TolA-binding protein